MQYIFRKTNQLSKSEKIQFSKLRSTVFATHMTETDFERKYTQTQFGYSYHGLVMVDGRIVGAYNAIPCPYIYFGRQVMFCLSVDAMIHTGHRSDPFSLLNAAVLLREPMVQDGISLIFGFPNDNLYEYLRRVLRWRDIGELDFYLLPRNIGGIFPKLKWLDTLCCAYASVLIHLPSWRLRNVSAPHIEKIADDTFKQRRYDSGHRTIGLENGAEVTYKVVTKESGLKALYVIDVNPLTAVAFDQAIRHVYGESGEDIDIVIFRGRLPFRPAGTIRLPRPFLGRYACRTRVCGRILDHQIVDDRIFNIDNWNINLSNNDVP